MRRLLLFLVLCAALPAAANERNTEGVGLTVYSAPAQNQYNQYNQQQYWNPATQRWEQLPGGYAVVKDYRKLTLQKGANTIRFTDVARLIDATTVHFSSLADPKGTAVVEQSFEYDLVSADKLLSKYIDKAVTLVLAGDKVVKGTLMSFDGAQIVLKTDDPSEPIQVVQRADNVRNIRFGALPQDLITKPTLVWLLDAAKAGEQLVKVTYQTNGMSWNADYTAVIAKDDKAIDLSAWVTITNQSGAGYKDADLKLVAGDVHRVTPVASTETTVTADKDAEDDHRAGGFQEKSFFEYHMYTLGRRTSIPDSSIKQIELFTPALGVPASKVFVYRGGNPWSDYGSPEMDQGYGVTGNKKVDIFLEFQNGQKQGLGIPLPAGRVRVYKLDDADNSLEFIGEDQIDHTPKDEKVRLRLGNAFDIVGERKQTDFKVDYDAHWLVESFEVKIRNHKQEDVEVLVLESMVRWVNWSIDKKSADYQKQDAHNVIFPLKVKKDGETVLTYTVRYTW